MIDLGAKAGDLSSWLGWSPPMRSTAIAELRRGVVGDPARWMSDTGIAPRSLDALLRERPATVENRWFARLYLLKALIIAVLAVFWLVSGLIAITVAYGDALEMMTRFGFPGGQSHAFVIVSSLTDIAVGLLIAFRRTSRIGLVAGIVVAGGYMLGTRGADAGAVDRAARRAGEDRPGDRADDGRARDLGRSVIVMRKNDPARRSAASRHR